MSARKYSRLGGFLALVKCAVLYLWDPRETERRLRISLNWRHEE